MRLAIFGGTFDPIHKGHLAIARKAARHFRLDRVLFVPAYHPPHKAGVTNATYEDRVRMAELACARRPGFEVSRLEEGTERSYSIDTIEKLVRMAPEDELSFLIGADVSVRRQSTAPHLGPHRFHPFSTSTLRRPRNGASTVVVAGASAPSPATTTVSISGTGMRAVSDSPRHFRIHSGLRLSVSGTFIHQVPYPYTSICG